MNYFFLGLSIPAVLDVHPPPQPQAPASANASLAVEFLRSLTTLLAEFESFQHLHPPEGNNSGPLSRTRIPQMFKRATQGGGKTRKPSGPVATDIGLPMPQISFGSPPSTADASSHQAGTSPLDALPTSAGGSISIPASQGLGLASGITGLSFASSSSYPASLPAEAHPNSSLLAGESPYIHLLTPPMPFVPDFFCVFATLCDVLIDVYQRLLQLVKSPSMCTVSVGEMFAKVDARIRKVIVGAIVRSFETAARESARREIIGVQRIVLGGLMGT